MPATETEALSTGLLGFNQKRHLRSFLNFCSTVNEETGQGKDGTDLTTLPMRALYERFSLERDAQDFVGHAVALQFDEDYVNRPAIETVRAIRLYATSLERFGRSPFIYPEFGLTALSEAFSRCVQDRFPICPMMEWMKNAGSASYCFVVVTVCRVQRLCGEGRDVHAEPARG